MSHKRHQRSKQKLNPQQVSAQQNQDNKNRYLSNTNAFQQAQIFAETYRKKYGLNSLCQTINQQLDYRVAQQKQKVKKVIMVSRHQHKLYKSLEATDTQVRQKVRKINQIKILKQQNNVKKAQKIMSNKFAGVSKHQKQVYKHFSEQQRKRRIKQKQQAYRLRRVQQEFLKLQKQQANISYERQRNSKSLYQSALQRLEKIYKDNQQFSNASQKQLNQSLSKSHFLHEISRKKSLQSLKSNKNTQIVLQKARQIKKARQSLYLTKHHINMSASQKAMKHKQILKKKSSEKINSFLQEKRKKWRQTKRRIDQQRKRVPQKCQSIIARSISGLSDSQRSLSPSASKTHEHNRIWMTRLKKYRAFRDTQRKNKEQKNQKHLNHHFQVKIKSQTNYKISQKFNSIVRKARHTSELQNYQYFDQ